MPRFSSLLLLGLLPALLPPAPALAQAPAAPPPGGRGAWQNPDIGLVYDLRADLNDVERDADGDRRWTSRGFDISTAEISIGADIDPYARMDLNVRLGTESAELHELYFLLPALPYDLGLKGGLFLAAFGRWNRFHSHALPFVSEPRILHEYLDGHLAPTGLELSWLVPITHFVEITGGLYDAITGHTHDTDPAAAEAAWGPDNPPPGCHFHGDELHCPDNPELENAYYASLDDPEAPVRDRVNRGLGDFAALGRLATSLELGLDWSIDLGGSVVHQPRYSTSQRFPGRTYGKTTYGADATVFWTPPEMNLYRGLDFGVEALWNDEQFETVRDGLVLQQDLVRGGLFGYLHYRHSRRWEWGAFGETFAPRRGDDDRRHRTGAFLTFDVSHYQALTLEVSRTVRSPGEDALHVILLRYDGVIGYHTHGSQR